MSFKAKTIITIIIIDNHQNQTGTFKNKNKKLKRYKNTIQQSRKITPSKVNST
jgi:hypothetical protein